MASVCTLLFVAVLPPLAMLLVTVAGRAAMRGLCALARAHFTWPAGSPFMHVDQARGRKGGRWAAPEQRDHELRVTLYCRRKEKQDGGGTLGQEEEAAAVECVFCLSGVEEGEEVRELRCRHVFHRACLDRWLATPLATCPLCRSRLLTTTPPPRAGEEDEELDLDSDLVLLMAYVHGGGSTWFWSP